MSVDNLAVLRARELELTAIYENVPGIVFYIAVEPDGEFRFLSVSRDFLVTTGLTRKQVVGSLVREIIPPPSCDMVLDHYREAIRSGQPVRWEEESVYPAGRKYGEVAVTPLYDAGGVATHLIGIVHDITDRKGLEESLRESEERLRLAMSSGNVGFWDWDLKSGRITWARELEGIYGLDHAGSYEAFSSRVHPDDLAGIEFERDSAIRNHKPWNLEFRVNLPSGGIRWLSSRGRGYYDKNGGVVRAAGIIIDITERVQVEQSLREAQDRLQGWNIELEQAVHLKTAELIRSEERLRALTTELNLAEQRERQRLAADLHDHLQQMLVLGKLKLAQGERLDDPVSVQIIKETDNVLSDALNYTHTLVAELSPPVLRYHGLAAGLKWLATYMKKYGIAVSVTVPSGREPKLPDEQVTLIFQSVRELLINSSKYACTGRADVSLEDENDRLVLTVRDEGKGIDLAALGAADSPSSLASSKFGLFSVRERMRALGGSFEIESSPGKGTTATLILPLGNVEIEDLKIEPPVRESREDSLPGTVSSGFQPNIKIRVLLVDDHAMVRQGLRTVLESFSDIEVVGEASDGEEAVQLAERLAPEVIIMDINMPKMNGIQATAEIKFRHPGMKIIAVSVNADEDYKRAMLHAGAETLLSKAAAVSELYRAIR
jgi:PAS domain S-box-containing protein